MAVLRRRTYVLDGDKQVMKIRLSQLRRFIHEALAEEVLPAPRGQNLDDLVKKSQTLAVNFVGMDREDIRNLASDIYEDLDWLNKHYDLVPKQK